MVGEWDAEILGGAQAGVRIDGGLRGWSGGAGRHRGRRVSGGRVKVAGVVPSDAEDFAGVDRDFATWRALSERGSILPGQKESMDLGGVVGAIQCFHCPFALPIPLGQPDSRVVGVVSRLGTVGSRPWQS